MHSAKQIIDGVLLLDKPIDMTSNAALQIVKKIYHARKAGHTGSLDPIATGMLPLCFGEATKFSQFMLNADKQYSVTAKLGMITETGDAEGAIIEQRPVGHYSATQLETVLTKFRGQVQQIPSMYSAIKHQGQPLYKLARQGITVERQPRSVTIYELALSAYRQDELELMVSCSKGTYIRTLVEDIGNSLGCGAHVIALRRTAISVFQDAPMISLATLKEFEQTADTNALMQCLMPIESALMNFPVINLSKAACFYLRRGQPIRLPQTPSHGWIRLYDVEQQFFGIGELLDDGRIAPRRLVVSQAQGQPLYQ